MLVDDFSQSLKPTPRILLIIRFFTGVTSKIRGLIRKASLKFAAKHCDFERSDPFRGCLLCLVSRAFKKQSLKRTSGAYSHS